ncbi:helix-turn-helix transcriptional regulator [Anaerolineales bacterium HSG6]|nr:helix-turn-helix transcriptional regulator [Anaerolineales bacterium HSG6]
MSRLGQKLRKLRQQHGLTSRELGAEFGVSNTHIINIENGKKRPSIVLVERISRYFEVTTDQLIKDELEV